MYHPVVLQDAKCILRWCVARYFGQNWVHRNSMLSLAWPNNYCQWRRMFSYLNDNRFLVSLIVFLMLANGNRQLHLHEGVLRKNLNLIWYSSIHFNNAINLIYIPYVWDREYHRKHESLSISNASSYLLTCNSKIC